MRSSKDTDIKNQGNTFDDLKEDVKLHIFSFLTTRDAVSATAVNQFNNSSRTEYFWRQRIALDYRMFQQPKSDPRNAYIDLHNERITKIRDLRFCTLGISRSGSLNIISDTTFVNDAYVLTILNKLIKFSEKNKIIDIQFTLSGTFYILTKDGLYGFGNNNLCQLGIDTGGKIIEKIICLYPSKKDDKILNLFCGSYYVAVQTERELWIAGELTRTNNNSPTTVPLSNWVVKIASGPYKLAIQYSDNSFDILDTYFFDGHNKQIDLIKIPHWVVKDFCQKNIIDTFFSGHHMIVWCEDGIYIHSSERHNRNNKADQFTRLEIFDDKNIIDIRTSDAHISVHCREGLYVAALDRSGVNEPENQDEFIKVDMDEPTLAMDLKIAAWPFIQIAGEWHEAESELDRELKHQTLYNYKEKLNFKRIEFAPLSKVVSQQSEVVSDDRCRCAIF